MAINLQSIQRQPKVGAPRLVVYGPHGVGKTTFLAGAPSPILLPFEDGMGTLQIPAFPILTDWVGTLEALDLLGAEEHEFKTVGIDSLDWLEPIVWAETSRRHGWADIETPGFGKGYLAAEDVWRELYTRLSALRDYKGMQVVLLAHTEIKKFNDPTSEPYDRYQIKLQPRASALAQEWADAVLFANYRTYTATADAGFNKKVTRGVGTGERVLFTEERPSHYAKNRYALPAELPLDYQAFSAALSPTT